MIKFKLKFGITIEMDAVAPDVSSQYQLASDYEELAALYPQIIANLKDSHGLFGHTIGDSCTAVDLQKAMASNDMARWEPKLIEGEEILDSYKPPKFPKGAKS